MGVEQAAGVASIGADAPKFTTGWCQLPGQKNEDTLAVFRSPALQYDHAFIQCCMSFVYCEHLVTIVLGIAVHRSTA